MPQIHDSSSEPDYNYLFDFHMYEWFWSNYFMNNPDFQFVHYFADCKLVIKYDKLL